MSVMNMKLLEATYGVCRLAPEEGMPSWVPTEGFVSITRTEDELSIVCDMGCIPDKIQCEKDWKILKVEGPLDFALVGILAKISTVLAEAGISIFAISTYDTDYILLKAEDMEAGITALNEQEYKIHIS